MRCDPQNTLSVKWEEGEGLLDISSSARLVANLKCSVWNSLWGWPDLLPGNNFFIGEISLETGSQRKVAFTGIPPVERSDEANLLPSPKACRQRQVAVSAIPPVVKHGV